MLHATLKKEKTPLLVCVCVYIYIYIYRERERERTRTSARIELEIIFRIQDRKVSHESFAKPREIDFAFLNGLRTGS